MKNYRLSMGWVLLALGGFAGIVEADEAVPSISRALSKVSYQWGMLNRVGTAVWIDSASPTAKGMHDCAQDAVMLTANDALLGAGLGQSASVYIPHEEREFEESYLLQIQPTIRHRDILSGVAVLAPTPDDWREIKLLGKDEAPQCLGFGSDAPSAEATAKVAWIPQFELSTQTVSISDQRPGFVPSITGSAPNFNPGSVLDLSLGKVDKGLLGALWIKGDAPVGMVVGQASDKKAEAIGPEGLRSIVQAVFAGQFPGRRAFRYNPEREEIAYEGLSFRQATRRFLADYGLQDAQVNTTVYLSAIEPKGRYVGAVAAVAPYSVYKDTRQIWWIQNFEQKKVTSLYVLLRALVENDRPRADGINMEVAFLGSNGAPQFALFGTREKETLTLLRFQMPSIRAAYKNWIQNEYLIQHPGAAQAGTELVFYMRDGAGKVISTLNPSENLKTVESNLDKVFSVMREKASDSPVFTAEEKKRLVDLNRNSLKLIAPFKDLQVYNLALNRDVEGRLVKLVQNLDLILKAREDAIATNR